MKESLAARQAALLRRNAELDEQVEAIEQRRQQQQQQQSQGSRPPSSSTAERRNRKKSAETSAVGSGSRHERMEDGGKEADSGGEDEHDDAAPVVPSALARSSSSRSHINLPMDLSASIDSFGAAARGGGEALNGQPDATKKQERLTKSRSGEAVTEDDDTSGLNSVGDRNKRSVSKVKTDDEDGGEGEGLGLEATVRYQKARLRVLQDEVDAASAQIKELETSQAVLKGEVDAAKAENAALGKKHQQAQQLLDKQRELTAALESKQRILEGQLSAAQAQVEEVQRAEKQTAQQFRSKYVRLNRALEELEKAKAQLQEEKRSSGQATVAKDEYDQLLRENRKLDKQKNELLAAFKKQMKLIDLLKRQRIHMEAAKMLSFTEEEFSKTLELG